MNNDEVYEVGTKIRRVRNPVLYCPIGFETVVKEHPGKYASSQVYYLNDDGFIVWGSSYDFEIVEESPVKEVTHKELVEGQYGCVSLDVVKDQYVVSISPENGWNISSSDLRKASKTLLEISEAVDDQAS